ncbi:dihydrofolate reductase family protein [Phycicoccus flavus]|uniref:dihydrofolate reductase family protein n=1 Tax=Phycicoccus flavus TaxID=2502783 RepID=UPI000FEB8A07|nr:dihydrofolate reductase family protein [Phycicoccus flavus]NHA70203.1 deaminase [Phycicoccus flavus]
MTVRVDLNVSVDGYATTTDQTPQDPVGADWMRLVEHYTATRTFRERVLHATDGSGTTGVDDDHVRESLRGVGAHVMGAGMFGLHTFPDDPDWTGWWGDEPPFGGPVLVLTHAPRPTLEFENGTTFTFLDAPLAEALDRARDVADGADVRLSGGVSLVREALAAGLVDRLHVAVTPILLGRGTNLWEGLRGLEDGYEVTAEAAPSGVLHLTFAR